MVGGWHSPKKEIEDKSRKIRPPIGGSGSGSSSIARINQVLVKCAKRAEPKRVIQDRPNRLIDETIPDLMSNSKLVELFRQEPATNADYKSVTEWTSVEFKRRNVRLEALLSERNASKIQQLRQVPSPSMTGYLKRSDRLEDLKSLTNYDLVHRRRSPNGRNSKSNRHTKKLAKSKKDLGGESKKEDEKSIIANNNDLFDLYGDDGIDAPLIVAENDDCGRQNEECSVETDLYGDLNQLPVSLDLIEEG